MDRVRKYRAWDGDKMLPWEAIESWHFNWISSHLYKFMDFTGKKAHNGREIYEGDILFFEEERDNGDVRNYVVVVWIEEWAMFAHLLIPEYNAYLSKGAEAIDETMFWTYTMDIDSEDYHYAGNIFENPDLLMFNGHEEEE